MIQQWNLKISFRSTLILLQKLKIKIRSASACYVLSEAISTANSIISSGADNPLLESYKIALPFRTYAYDNYLFYDGGDQGCNSIL